jgi:hypothetical protein
VSACGIRDRIRVVLLSPPSIRRAGMLPAISWASHLCWPGFYLHPRPFSLAGRRVPLALAAGPDACCPTCASLRLRVSSAPLRAAERANVAQLLLRGRHPHRHAHTSAWLTGCGILCHWQSIPPRRPPFGFPFGKLRASAQGKPGQHQPGDERRRRGGGGAVVPALRHTQVEHRNLTNRFHLHRSARRRDGVDVLQCQVLRRLS